MSNSKITVERASALCAAILAAVAVGWSQPATLAAENSALPVEEVVARLSDGPNEWAMFAFGEGEPVAARGGVRRGGVVLALPVRHARTGYLQNDVRLDGSGEIVLASGTAMFEQVPRGQAPAIVGARVWCAPVAERALCVRNSPQGGGAVAQGEGAAYAPRSLSSAQTPSTSARVAVDPEAASRFPYMEFVYSFVRWDDAYMYLEQGLRVDGRIVRLGELRAPRRPNSALVNAGRGAVRIRPGTDAYSGLVSLATPRLDEAAHLRRAAEAIARLPPGEGVAASPELLDSRAPLSSPTQAAAPALPVARVALPGPEPNRCTLASYEANSSGQSLRLAPGLITERPSGEDFGRFFPREAAQARLDGRAVIVCAIDEEGGLKCLVQSEAPAGYGFGEAALKISTRFRIAERLPNGRPTAGGALRLPIRFCHPG
jgi:protein TonB